MHAPQPSHASGLSTIMSPLLFMASFGQTPIQTSHFIQISCNIMAVGLLEDVAKAAMLTVIAAKNEMTDKNFFIRHGI